MSSITNNSLTPRTLRYLYTKDVSDYPLGWEWEIDETPQEVINLEGMKYLRRQQREDRVYRGISEKEWRFIQKTGSILSDCRYCLPSEGTCFSKYIEDAESYVNVGHTSPLITGRPNYIVEVRTTPEMYVDTDSYTKCQVPLESSLITRVWEMKVVGDALVVEEIRASLQNSKSASLSQYHYAYKPAPKSLAYRTTVETNLIEQEIEQYLNVTISFPLVHILSEDEWKEEVESSTAENLFGGTAAIYTEEGTILIREGYESDLLHELIHHSGMVGSINDYLSEGLVQAVSEALAQDLQIKIRPTYQKQVQFIHKYILPLTGLSLRELAQKYVTVEDFAEWLTGHIWERYEDTFRSNSEDYGEDAKYGLERELKEDLGSHMMLRDLKDHYKVATTSARLASYKPAPKSLTISRRKALDAAQYFYDLDENFKTTPAVQLIECCLWKGSSLKTVVSYFVKSLKEYLPGADTANSMSDLINSLTFYGRLEEQASRVLNRWEDLLKEAKDLRDVDLEYKDYGEIIEMYDYEYGGEGSFSKEAKPFLDQLSKLPYKLNDYLRYVDDQENELEWWEHKFKQPQDSDPHPPGVEDLEVVWHATTAYRKILKEGLKNRSELGGSGGLGGSASTGKNGVKEGISFTGNEEIARAILQSFWDMARLLQGPRTKEDFLEFAAELEVSEETIREYIRELFLLKPKEKVEDLYSAFNLIRHIIGQASVLGTYYDPVYISEKGMLEMFARLDLNDTGVIEAIIDTSNPDVMYLRSMDEWRVPLEAILSIGPVGSQQLKLEQLKVTK